MKYIYQYLNTVNINDGKLIYDDLKTNERPYTISTPVLIDAFKAFTNSFENIVLVQKNKQSNSQTLYMVEGQAFLSQINKIDEKSIIDLGLTISTFILEEFTHILGESNGKVEPFATSWGPYFSSLSEISDLRSFVSQYITSKNKIFQKGYFFVQEI